MEYQTKLGIIIINWNAYGVTHKCLKELFSWKTNLVVYVIDNASANDEAKRIKNEFPSCRVLESTRNIGYAGANNLGLRQALKDNCSHMLLLNNDAMIDEKSVMLLIEACNQDNSVALAGPVITDESGHLILNAGGRDIAKYDITHLKAVKHSSQCYAVDYVSGTAALLKAESIRQNGYLDENFFF